MIGYSETTLLATFSCVDADGIIAIVNVSEENAIDALRLAADGVRLDHIGIAVQSIDAARKFYVALGLKVAVEELIAHEQVKTAMLPLGETRLELLEATSETSAIAKFIAKRGEGLHHIAIRVPDVDAAFKRMQVDGLRLASDSVRIGAGGHRYFFVHPASVGGVLVEIVGA